MKKHQISKLLTKSIIVLAIGMTTISCASVHSNEDQEASNTHTHGMHENTNSFSTAPTGVNDATLTYPGNMIFGTVQEVVNRLLASPETDWSKVNVEGLRQHLLDMKNFSEKVSVISKADIDNGTVIIIQAETNVVESLERALAAHPDQLFQESGWTMEVVQAEDKFTLTVTTEDLSELPKLRGLGYFGLMVYGNHHVAHHWLMIQGIDAHS